MVVRTGWLHAHQHCLVGHDVRVVQAMRTRIDRACDGIGGVNRAGSIASVTVSVSTNDLCARSIFTSSDQVLSPHRGDVQPMDGRNSVDRGDPAKKLPRKNLSDRHFLSHLDVDSTAQEERAYCCEVPKPR